MSRTALLSETLQQLLNTATVVDMPEPDGETRHFHAWFRSGRVFVMQTRLFRDRTGCHKWAAKQRQAKEDRLVLACTKCPVSRRSTTPSDSVGRQSPASSASRSRRTHFRNRDVDDRRDVAYAAANYTLAPRRTRTTKLDFAAEEASAEEAEAFDAEKASAEEAEAFDAVK